MKKVKNIFLNTDKLDGHTHNFFSENQCYATGLVLELEDGSFWAGLSTDFLIQFEKISENIPPVNAPEILDDFLDEAVKNKSIYHKGKNYSIIEKGTKACL